MLCATLASCGKVNGTYTADLTVLSTGAKITYDFGAFKKVTLTVETLVAGSVTGTKIIEGKYDVEEKDDGSMNITFTFESKEEEATTYGGTQTLKIDKENDTITIGLVTYKKV